MKPKTKIQLAEALGIHRKTLYEWSFHPDSPDSLELEEWEEFKELKRVGSNPELKARLLEEQIRKLEIENRKRSEELIPVDMAIEVWGQLAREWIMVIKESGLDSVEREMCFKSLDKATGEIEAIAEKGSL